MIVKNEEQVLAKCLESVKSIVDEIIIVDTGSTDNTKEIASQYTDKIFDFAWENDFATARNFSFSKATMDYQMWLDADDIITPENAEKIAELKANLPPDTDMVIMPYWYKHTGSRPLIVQHRERLLKRSKNFLWQEPIHEFIPMQGKAVKADILVLHCPLPEKEKAKFTRNLDIYKALVTQNKLLPSRSLRLYAQELKASGNYEEAIKHYKLALESPEVTSEDKLWITVNLAACLERLGKVDFALDYLQSVKDTGRAEVYCEIGFCYQQKGEYDEALKWFLSALSAERPTSATSVIYEDCWGFIPHLELSVCYDNIGNFKLAYKHNEQAATFYPDNEFVLANRSALNKKIMMFNQ
jgi:tetratricopeptide (TPR) repeat protein